MDEMEGVDSYSLWNRGGLRIRLKLKRVKTDRLCVESKFLMFKVGSEERKRREEPRGRI